MPVDHTLSSSKCTLLNTWGSLGETIIEIVAADVALHEQELERRPLESFREVPE